MPISFSLFIYNIPASQILHARMLFLTNFVQRYELSLTLPNFSRLFLHSRNRPYRVLKNQRPVPLIFAYLFCYYLGSVVKLLMPE